MDDYTADMRAGLADLSGRIALVTGGARNVGAAIATRLAAAGATVIINHFRSPEQARHTLAEIERSGGHGHIIRASVARPEQVAAMFAEVTETFGRLDILVNSAADGRFVTGDYEPNLLDRAFDTNVKGSLACAQAARPLLRAAGGGSIINVSTLGGGTLVMHGYAACGPAKAALETLTRYLAVEYARDGIRVNTAAAGMLASPVADQFPDASAMHQAVVAATPLGRLGTPEELAEVVAFLAGPGSRWITGQTILADGGLSTGAALLAPASDAARSVGAGSATGSIAPSRSPQRDNASESQTLRPAPTKPAQPAQPSASEPRQAPQAEPQQTPTDAPAEPNPKVPERTDASDQPSAVDDEIVIVGMGITVAGANNPQEFWDELLHGADRFVEVPLDRWDNSNFYNPDHKAVDKTYSQHSAFITDFVPEPGAEATSEDGTPPEYTAMWLRHAVVQGMRDVARAATDKVSMFVGYTADGSHHLEEASVVAGVQLRAAAGADSGDDQTQQRAQQLATELGRRYRRSGPNPERFLPHLTGHSAVRDVLPEDVDVVMVDTACSSSLYTIDLGVKALREGRADVAVAGGAFALAPRGSILFAKLNGLSATGEVRSLDADGDGVLFADGAAAVVLKRLSKARADGDTILATVTAIGSSSDGKGKAIYAPKADGQKLAIARAQSGHDLAPAWVVAHATGTPAGDLAEYATLRDMYGTAPVPISSNKSIVGHTGWAAGAVSVIQAILGLAHDTIPPQHRFTRTPDLFEADQDQLIVPTEALPLPRDCKPGHRRTVAVSGFGFGGTNAHVLIQDPPAPEQPIKPADPATAIIGQERQAGSTSAERIAVIAVGQHTPPHDGPTFGDQYPLPPVSEVVMPPGMMRALDRAQLMVLAAARSIKDELGQFWEQHRARTGVLLGHLGPTRNAMLYATRCYLDDLRTFAATGEMAQQPWAATLVEQIAEQLRTLVPDSSENTFPGMMPNVISSRIANYYNLQGINMTLDTGFTGAARALDIAASYLRAGDIDMALAGGINGNATPEMSQIVAPLLSDNRCLHEGAFILALVTESTAQAAGLPVLGFIEAGPRSRAHDLDGQHLRTVRAGADAGERTSCYLGAEAAYALCGALTQVATEPKAHMQVLCTGGPGAGDAVIEVSGAHVPATEPSDAGQGSEPVRSVGDPEPDTQLNDQVQRHIVSLVPTIGRVVADPTPFWPGAPTVVITNSTAAAQAAAGRADAALLIGPGLDSAGHQPDLPKRIRRILGTPNYDQVHSALGELVNTEGDVHVRIILDTSRLGTTLVDHATAATAASPVVSSTGATTPEEQAADDLHQCAFLVLKVLNKQLSNPGASIIVVAAGTPGVHNHVPVPEVGLLRGMVKVAAMEFSSARVFMLISDHAVGSVADITALATAAERESQLDRGLPIVYLSSGMRRVERLVTAPADPAELRLNEHSRVVALGGGRGITAELLVGLAHRCRPDITIIGSNDIDAHEPHLLAASDEQFAGSRPGFIRHWIADFGGSVKEANAAFGRVEAARTVRANLERMRAHGSTVTYVCADGRDRLAMRRAVGRVLADGEVDLLINAAGVSRSTPIETKSLAEFTTVRDLKLASFRGLRAAFAGHMPSQWVNFGSLLGLTGQVGEVDYASANDFLAAASVCFAAQTNTGGLDGNRASISAEASRVGPRPVMTTIGWTLWGQIGLGATELTKAYFEKTGMYSAMSTREGVRHFLRELAVVNPPAFTVHLGAKERAAVERLVPGFLVEVAADTPNADPRDTDTTPRAHLGAATPPAPGSAPEPASAGATAPNGQVGAESAQSAQWVQAVEHACFIDRIVEHTPTSIVAEREFSLPRDNFLADHAVAGVATLPGMFVPEMVEQVATALVPNMVMHAIENLRFIHFLKVHPGVRTTYRIKGTRTPATRGQARVEVTVSSDVIAPNGTLLVADRVHFRATALLATGYPPSPHWQPWPDLQETAVPDPYHAPGAPVLLTGPFVTTTQTRLHPYGKRATYRSALGAEGAAQSPWSSWATPGLLLDGLARTGVLDIGQDGLVPLAAPLSIERIDFFERINDVTAAERYDHLDLYAVVERSGFMGPDHETFDAANRFAAVAPDGHIVTRFRDLQWVVLGELNPNTGQFNAPPPRNRGVGEPQTTRDADGGADPLAKGALR